MVDDNDIIQLKRHPDWRATLQVYDNLQQAIREQSPEADGWVPRPIDFEGIDASRISSIHGKLIAFGFLKFDVSLKDIGVRYQLTPEGRRALHGEAERDSDDDDDSSGAESEQKISTKRLEIVR